MFTSAENLEFDAPPKLADERSGSKVSPEKTPHGTATRRYDPYASTSKKKSAAGGSRGAGMGTAVAEALGERGGDLSRSASASRRDGRAQRGGRTDVGHRCARLRSDAPRASRAPRCGGVRGRRAGDPRRARAPRTSAAWRRRPRRGARRRCGASRPGARRSARRGGARRTSRSRSLPMAFSRATASRLPAPATDARWDDATARAFVRVGHRARMTHLVPRGARPRRNERARAAEMRELYTHSIEGVHARASSCAHAREHAPERGARRACAGR